VDKNTSTSLGIWLAIFFISGMFATLEQLKVVDNKGVKLFTITSLCKNLVNGLVSLVSGGGVFFVIFITFLLIYQPDLKKDTNILKICGIIALLGAITIGQISSLMGLRRIDLVKKSLLKKISKQVLLKTLGMGLIVLLFGIPTGLLVGGSFAGLIYWGLSQLTNFQFGMQIAGFFGVVILALVIGFIGDLSSSINLLDNIKLMKFKILRSQVSAMFGFGFGLLSGLISMMAVSQMIGMKKGFLLGFIVFSVTFVAIFGLTNWLLEDSFELKRYPQTNNAYQRLRTPIFLEYIFLLFIVIGVSSKFSPGEWPAFLLVLSVVLILYNFIFTSVGKHFLLRILLWFEGAIPFQLIHFLDIVSTKTGLMEKDGGNWRFRHQLIQDVLADTNIDLSSIPIANDQGIDTGVREAEK
jgi:hypothetical protein